MNKKEALMWIRNSDGWSSIYVGVCLDKKSKKYIAVSESDARDAIFNSEDVELRIEVINEELYLG